MTKDDKKMLIDYIFAKFRVYVVRTVRAKTQIFVILNTFQIT